MSAPLRVGQPFSPFRLFHGIFVPETLVRTDAISPGAKLAYGRLCRYAGQDGRCYPAVGTLGSEIGISERQAQRYLAELERANLIRRVERFVDGAQVSNAFEFLWHSIFATGVTDLSREGVTDISPPGVTDPSPKESHFEESHFEETHTSNLYHRPENRKKRDPRLFPEDERFSQSSEALPDDMMKAGQGDVYHRETIVMDIVDPAGGPTEECLGIICNQSATLYPGADMQESATIPREPGASRSGAKGGGREPNGREHIPAVALRNGHGGDPAGGFDEFCGLFLAAGKKLCERDIERALRLWISHSSEHDAIMADVRPKFTNGTWSDTLHTPMPQNYLRSQAWRRRGPGRLLPDPPKTKGQAAQQEAARRFLEDQ